MKKLISILLTLSMLLALATVFATGAVAETQTATSTQSAADDAAAAEGNKVRYNGNYYKSLVDAYNAASGKAELYLIADITDLSTWQMNRSAVTDVVIEGQGHLLKTGKYTHYVMNLHATASVTLKNMRLETCRGFYNYGTDKQTNETKKTILLENVNVKMLDADCSDNEKASFHFFDGRFYTFDITLSNSTVETEAGWGFFRLVSGKQQVIRLKNSKLSMNGMAYNGDKNENALFSGWSNTAIDIYVDSKSTLENKNSYSGSASQAFLSSCHCSVYLEAGASMVLAPTGAIPDIRLSRADETTFYDAGATLTLSANAQKQGVSLKNWKPAKDNTLIGMTDGTTATTLPEKLKDANAKQDLTLQLVQADMSGFVMQDGASIRKEDPYGIRFSATLSATLVKALQDNGIAFTYGMVVAPTALLGEQTLDVEKLTEDQYRQITCTKLYDEETASFHLALVGFAETKQAFETKLSARAFITYTLNGTDYTIYTAYNEEKNARCIYEVAKAAKTAGESGAAIDKVIQTVEAGSTGEGGN